MCCRSRLRIARARSSLSSTRATAAARTSQTATRSEAGVSVSVPCKPLVSVLREAGIASIDALKIDVEGAEDIVLVPFLRDAPRELLPELVLIEDTRGFWQTDVFALLEQHGYTVVARNRQNVAYRRAR